MAKQKKQHYVSRFYLKNFSNNSDKKTIGIFNIQSEKFIRSGSIKNEAYSDNIYGKDGVIETALGGIEGVSAKVIFDIIQKKGLPKHKSDKHDILLVFVLLLSARTKFIAESMDELLDKQMRVMFANHPYARKHLDEVKFKYEYPALLALRIASETRFFAADLRFKLLVNETKLPFITSDNPVVKYNQFLANRSFHGSNVGLASKGLQIILPLSPNVCVIFYDSDVYKIGRPMRRIIRVKKIIDINEINKIQLVNANENIYFDDAITEKFVMELAKKGKKFRRKKKANISVYDAYDSQKGRKGKVMHMFQEDVHTNLQLSFISITQKARRYDLSKRVVYVRKPKLMNEYERLRGCKHYYEGNLIWGQDTKKEEL